jgi:hypothetical protein
MLDNRYKCPFCSERITVGKRKHIVICSNCYRTVDLSKVRVKKVRSNVSVLDRILGLDNVAHLSASAILAKMGV